MTWLGPALSGDQRDVLGVVSDVLEGVDATDTTAMAAMPRRLAELGLWTIGASEESGGGGADWPTTAVLIERISRVAPELGLACAHAHAAAAALGSEGDRSVLDGIHSADREVIVVESGAPHVTLTVDGERRSGRLDRFDALDPESAGLLLVGEQCVYLDQTAIVVGHTHRTTGLAGMTTVSITFEGHQGRGISVLDADPAAVRSRLLGGIAAVAAGIAGAAYDSAVSYAQSRRQFGGPIAAIPVVRMLLETQAVRTAHLLRALLAGEPDALGGVAIAREGCDVALDVTDAALQVHGGYGYLREYPAERFVRDAVSLRHAVDVSHVTSILQLHGEQHV